MKREPKTIDVETLRHWLTYEPETGLIRWRVKPLGQRRKEGDIAGNRDKQSGYIQIRLFYTKVYGHRVAWALYHGEWPSQQIDHINLQRDDNRIANLRLATHQQNAMNQPKRKSKTGMTGVYRSTCGYVAQMKHNRRTVYLGHFKSPEEAKSAYDAAILKARGEFAKLHQ